MAFNQTKFLGHTDSEEEVQIITLRCHPKVSNAVYYLFPRARGKEM